MSKTVNKKMGICILAGIILLVTVIAISIATGKKFSQSGEVSNPTFTDEDGKVYVAAFLKKMTENNISWDILKR